MKKLGEEFELAVAKIQQAIAPQAKLEKNIILTDRLGHKREFDIVFKTTTCGHSVLGVIECKDFNKPVNVEYVDAFATKSTDVNSNIKILISKLGFTKKALEKASFHGIAAYSLIPNENFHSDLEFYVTAKMYWVEKINLQLVLSEKTNTNINFKGSEVFLDNKRVIDWYKNHLVSNFNEFYLTKKETGINVSFLTPVNVNIKGEYYQVSEFKFSSILSLDERSKKCKLNGDGFYDWSNREIKPSSEKVMELGITDFDFKKWPKKRKDTNYRQLDFIISLYSLFEYNEDAIDLEAYP